eukprot:7383061-Prymnesium_polylepis.2
MSPGSSWLCFRSLAKIHRPFGAGNQYVSSEGGVLANEIELPLAAMLFRNTVPDRSSTLPPVTRSPPPRMSA